MAYRNVSTRSQLYWNMLLRMPTQAAAFVISLIVARILMPSDYGIMGVAMMLIGFANLFTDFGFSAAIVQKEIRDKDTLQSIFTFNLAASVALAVLFALSARLIAAFFRSAESASVIMVMTCVFVITSFSAVPRAILRRDLDFRTLSMIDTASAISMSLLTLILALAHWGYWALALGQLVPALVFTVYVCARVRWAPVVIYRHSAMKRILDFGFWNVLKTQLEFALGHVDKMILGRVAGLTSLGYYDKALSISAAPNESLVSGFNAVLFSSFSQKQHDPRELQELFKKGLMVISVLSFPLHVGLVVVAGPFVNSLLGATWAPMTVTLQLTAASMAIRSTHGFLVATNVAIGQYRAHTLRFGLAGCVFVAMCLLLVHDGAVGVATALFLGSVLAVALGLQLAVKALALSWSDVVSACWPAAKGTVLMVVVTELVSWLFHGQTLPALIGISVAGALSYALCLAFETDSGFLALKRALVADLKIFGR